MSIIYCTVRQLAELFHIDYSTMLYILHEDSVRDLEIKKLGRYELNHVVQLHKTTIEPMEVNLKDDFLNLQQVQKILHDKLGSMVYSTVLRKAAKGEIPALKFGDTYRVPETVLFIYLKQQKISYRKKNKFCSERD